MSENTPPYRLGPKPLPFQLAMASLASAGLAGGKSYDAQTLQAFFRGIQKYQGHDFHRPSMALDVLWQEGAASLYCAPDAGGGKAAVPVVLIPSMVNRSDILDLLPERSLLRWLAAQGLRACLFDWGEPMTDAGQESFDAALTQRLIPALEAIEGPVIVLGYCMGGLFATALAVHRPEKVKAAILLATPWDFHAGEVAYLKNRLVAMGPMASLHMAQHGSLPQGWMQAVFASLDPESTIDKFARFAAMENDAEEALFVAVEDWVNNGVDLPAAIAGTCLNNWYEGNEPARGAWVVAGKSVRAADVSCPVMLVAAKGDKITPPESALAFAAGRENVQTLVCETGHVGLLAGRKAVEAVWKPVADWCKAHQ